MELADIIIWLIEEVGCYANDDGNDHIYIDGSLSIGEIKELTRKLEEQGGDSNEFCVVG